MTAKWKRLYVAALDELVAEGEPFKRADVASRVDAALRGDGRERCYRARSVVARALDAGLIRAVPSSGTEGDRRPRYVAADVNAPASTGRRQIFARGVSRAAHDGAARYAAARGLPLARAADYMMRRLLAAGAPMYFPMDPSGHVMAAWLRADVVDAITAQGATAAGALRATLAAMATAAETATEPR